MNEYPFHPVDNETTRKQALIDYDAKLKGEGLAPIEWTYVVESEVDREFIIEAEVSVRAKSKSKAMSKINMQLVDLGYDSYTLKFGCETTPITLATHK